MKQLEVIAAHQVPMEEVENFILQAEHVDLKALLTEGYVVKMDGTIQGCFVLSTMEKDILWLKQLHIMQPFARYLPVLLEIILQMTKEKQAKKLYVHSHQTAIDLLLDALQFHLQNDLLALEKYRRQSGNWWAYDVS